MQLQLLQYAAAFGQRQRLRDRRHCTLNVRCCRVQHLVQYAVIPQIREAAQRDFAFPSFGGSRKRPAEQRMILVAMANVPDKFGLMPIALFLPRIGRELRPSSLAADRLPVRFKSGRVELCQPAHHRFRLILLAADGSDHESRLVARHSASGPASTGWAPISRKFVNPCWMSRSMADA